MQKTIYGFSLLLASSLLLAACTNQAAKDAAISSSQHQASQQKQNSLSTASKKEALDSQSTSIKIADASLAAAKSANRQTTESSQRTSRPAETTTTVKLTDSQKTSVTQAFLTWAEGQAKIGNMAVSDWYFDHGAAGRGDWFADSPDGRILVQSQVAQSDANDAQYPIHAIGGCVFYTAKDGTVGHGNLYQGDFASNYSIDMDMSRPVSKYLLGDNGKVYELKTGNGQAVSTNTGFGEVADDGQSDEIQSVPFSVSQDQDAQSELKTLLAQY